MNRLKSRTRQTLRGVVFFFTGLPSAGKSTLAEYLRTRLENERGIRTTLLDGDVIRQHLGKGLSFSKEDRDENVRRVGFVSSEIAKHGGVAICALIAPYADTRKHVRAMIEPHGAFIEIHIATSLEECERRDVKGMYAEARAGKRPGFTGIDDPYDIPDAPELSFSTEGRTPDDIVAEIVAYAADRKYL